MEKFWKQHLGMSKNFNFQRSEWDFCQRWWYALHIVVEEMNHLAWLSFIQRIKRPEEFLAHTTQLHMAISSVILLPYFFTKVLLSKLSGGKSSLALAHWCIHGAVLCKAKTKYSNLAPILKGYFLLLKYKWSCPIPTMGWGMS